MLIERIGKKEPAEPATVPEATDEVLPVPETKPGQKLLEEKKKREAAETYRKAVEKEMGKGAALDTEA